MRILHAVVSDQLAGVERYVAGLSRAQAAAGHDVTVVGGPAPAGADAVTAGGPEHRPAETVPSLAREIRAARVDVVHVHMTAAEVAATLALGARARRSRPAVVSTRHFARRRGHGPAGRLVAAVARHTVDAQIAISDYVAGALDGASTVVRTGVADRPDCPPAAAREHTVLVAQRLQPEKRGDLAVEAFARAGLAAAGWRLVVAGDGAERERLERLARRHGLDESCQFLGAREDVPDLMRTAGVLLAPCPVEGLGLSVLEAMASGLPVVAAAAGGHLELLRGLDPAHLVPAGDCEAMAGSLRALAADPARREAAAARAAARQRSRFTVSAQAAGVERVYAQVLADRAPRTRRPVPA